MIRRAQDGLPARVSGRWTQEKLAYVEKYARAFMTAMAPKRRAGKWDQLVGLIKEKTGDNAEAIERRLHDMMDQ